MVQTFFFALLSGQYITIRDGCKGKTVIFAWDGKREKGSCRHSM